MLTIAVLCSIFIGCESSKNVSGRISYSAKAMLVAQVGKPLELMPKSITSPRAQQNRAFILSDRDRAIVKEGVRDGLKDPGSAIFGEMFASSDEKKTVTVCGTVNAKNGFGGYNGQMPYFGILSQSTKKYVMIGLATSKDYAIIMGMCKEAGAWK